MPVTYVCGECGGRAEAAGTCEHDGHALEQATDPLLGTDVGRYRLTRVLGQGGMGRVYAAVHAGAGSRVAIKVISEQYAQNRDVLDRFFAEARAVNLIRHEYIVNVIDLAQLRDGRPYIVMEYIEGRTLRELARSRALPLGGLVQLVVEVLSALGAAHAIGIVHRDLKPDNILVTTSGRPKVLDFGIAKLSTALPGIVRTQAGIVLGTPEYMSPEQACGAELDARCDVYAVGVMLYEAVTGKRPFDGPDFEVMKAHLEREPQSPRELRPDLPEALEAVILRALAKRPADRFPTAKAMAKALRRAAGTVAGPEWKALTSRESWLAPAPPTSLLDSKPEHATAIVPRLPVAAPPRRRAGLALVAGTGIVALGIAVGFGLGARDAPEPAPASHVADALPARSPPADDRLDRLRAIERRRADRVRVANGRRGSDTRAPGGRSPGDGIAVSAPAPGGGELDPDDTRSTSSDGARVDADRSALRDSLPDGPAMLVRPIDARSFDPIAYVATARDLAREIEPGAELVELDAREVAPTGALAMTDVACVYTFRSSAARRRRDSRETHCGVRITIGPRQAVAQRIHWLTCFEPTERAPRCTLSHVWRAAGAKPTGTARLIWRDERWLFDAGGREVTLGDDCP